MILERLVHRGFIAFPDRIEIDFTNLPPIVGIGGATGAGKTSLLEAICLARHGHTAYRDSAPPKQFGPRGGFTELTCNQGGERIRTRITVEGERTEGMLWRGDRQIGGPLIKDFRAKSLDVFGSLELFQATAYACQPKAHGKDTSGSFLRADRASRKDLFASMLGLNTYERRQGVAKDRAKTLLGQVELVRARTQEHEAVVTRSTEILEARRQVVERIEAAHARVEAATQRANEAREQRAALAEAKAAIEAKRPQLEQLDREVTDLQQRIRDAVTRRQNNEGVLGRADEIQQAATRDEALKLERAALEPLDGERTRLQREVAKVADRIGRLRRELTNVEATLARVPEIEAAVKKTGELNEALRTIDGEAETARTSHQTAVSAFHATEMLRQERAAKVAEIGRLTDAANRLAVRLQQLRVDLGDATQLEAQIPDIKEAVSRAEELAGQRERLSDQIAAARTDHQAAVADFHAAEMLRQNHAGKLAEKQRLEQDAAIIRTVPCHEEGLSNGCQFLVRAGEAAGAIQLIAGELETLEAKLLDAPTEPPTDPTPPLTEQLHQLQAQIDALQPLVVLAAGIDGALERAARLRTEIMSIEEEASRARESQTAVAAEVTALDERLIGAPATAPVDPVPAFAARRLKTQQDILALANVVSLAGGIDAARKDRRELTEEISGLQEEAKTAEADLGDVDLRLARIPAIDLERQKLAPTVALQPRIEQAQARIEELDRTIAQCREDEAVRTAVREALKAELGRIGILESQIGLHEGAETRATEEIKVERQRLNTLNAELGAVNGKLEAIERSREALARAEAELRPMLEDIPEWNLLARAFGPIGIPTLKIDQALPEVGATATTLLRECFGESLFTITLTTQKLAADESKLLETFDLMVSRGGKPMLVDDLSGGEGALVSEALSLALAVRNSSRSRIAINTLLRDETAAALDTITGTALRYVSMLRKVARLADFHHIVFISHNLPSLEAADVKIMVSKGALTIS